MVLVRAWIGLYEHSVAVISHLPVHHSRGLVCSNLNYYMSVVLSLGYQVNALIPSQTIFALPWAFSCHNQLAKSSRLYSVVLCLVFFTIGSGSRDIVQVVGECTAMPASACEVALA